jgi:hemin uptake protein HemP
MDADCRANGAARAPAKSAESSAAWTADMPVHDARDLTAGGARAILVLDGMAYSLRITRAGKLILTK